MRIRAKKVKVPKFSAKAPKMWRAKKTFRSDTGGTVKVIKGNLDPDKHDSTRLKDFK